MSTSTLHIAPNSNPAYWIAPRLHRFALDVGSIIPDAFGAYARIFHPPQRYAPDGTWTPVRWHEIAAANGRSAEEELRNLDHLAYPSQDGKDGETLWEDPPLTGSLSTEIAGVLVELLRPHTTTPEHCWFAVWEGYAGLRQRWSGAPAFSIPERDLLLLAGDIDDARETVDPGWHYQSANLWWPDDRTWCVATEIDFTWTYVGGSPSCIAQLLEDARIEALPVTATMRR